MIEPIALQEGLQLEVENAGAASPTVRAGASGTNERSGGVSTIHGLEPGRPAQRPGASGAPAGQPLAFPGANVVVRRCREDRTVCGGPTIGASSRSGRRKERCEMSPAPNNEVSCVLIIRTEAI